jgi:hypothetical protein
MISNDLEILGLFMKCLPEDYDPYLKFIWVVSLFDKELFFVQMIDPQLIKNYLIEF